jgi:hypothetical protein
VLYLVPPAVAAGKPIPRISRAAFMEAGMPEVVTLASEGTSVSNGSEVIVQLMGLALNEGAITSTSTLRFILRFYDFAPTPTTAATLIAAHHALIDGVNSDGEVLLLSPVATSVNATSEPSNDLGIRIGYKVPGGSNSAGGEAHQLKDYLRFGTMEVEAWDAVSLVHVGTATVPLAGLADANEDTSQTEVALSVPLLEPVLPAQDASHASRSTGWLQLRLARKGMEAMASSSPTPVPGCRRAPISCGPLVSMQPGSATQSGKQRRVLVAPVDGDTKKQNNKNTAKNVRDRMELRLRMYQAAQCAVETAPEQQLGRLLTAVSKRDDNHKCAVDAALARIIDKTVRVQVDACTTSAP